MLRSLYSGVSGIKTHQTGIDVIGNNISNVNTTAYKSTAVSFDNLLSQNLKNASAATATTAGTNPKQVGLGTSVGSHRLSIAQEGAAKTTNELLDFRISDVTAFWIVREGNESHYTRDGSFSIDAGGNLVMANTGYYVYGWTSEDGVNINKENPIGPLHIVNVTKEEQDADTWGLPTTWARIEGTLDGKDGSLVSGGAGVELELFNADGEKYIGRFVFKDDMDENQLTYSLVLSSLVNEQGQAIALANPPEAYQVEFDSDTNKVVKVNGQAGTKTDIKMPADFGISSITMDVSGLTLKTNPEKDVTIEGALPEWVKVDEGAIVNSQDAGYMANIYNKDGVDHASTVLDFSELEDDLVNNKASLINEGFHFTCCTCTNYYSVQFVEGNEHSMEYSGRHFIYKVGIDDVTSAEDLVDAIISATDDGNPYEHYTRLDKDGNKLIIYDERPIESEDPSVYCGKPDLEREEGIFNKGVAVQNKIDNNTSVTSLRGDADGNGVGLVKGYRVGYTIDTAGRIWGKYSNGGQKLLGQMTLAEFTNPTGLESIGNDCYDVTLNSGPARTDTIDAFGGKVISGQLEMSNVSLSDEMTQMIIMQRGFQANSRIVTVSDTLLEELIRLKQ